MNVANKDLCQELYELSKWDDTWFDKDDGTLLVWKYSRADYEMHIGLRDEDEQLSGFQEAYPAYDLGYLLRKLPNTIKQLDGWRYLTVMVGHSTGGYIACYYKLEKPHFDKFNQQADTPEDCAAKLAIELIKQGILK